MCRYFDAVCVEIETMKCRGDIFPPQRYLNYGMKKDFMNYRYK